MIRLINITQRKGVKQDEEAFEQKGSCERSRLLAKPEKNSNRKSWQVMPQVKRLQELNVAGLATTRAGMAGPFRWLSAISAF
jgi:hypothetical protein